MKVDPATLRKLQQWSQKTGRSVEELQNQLQQYFDEIKQLNPNLDDVVVLSRARFLLYRDLKSEIISPAVWFEGVFVGYGEAWDVTEPLRKQILAEYEVAPEKTIAEGKVQVTPEGQVIPIDFRPTLPDGRTNPWYKKPIRPVIVRNMLAIARKVGTSEFKFLVLTAMLDQAENLPPLGEPVKFRALPRDEQEHRIIARTSRVTKYIKTTIPEFEKENIISLLRAAPDKFKAALKQLPEYYDATANDRHRIVIIEGDVLQIGAVTSRGNRLILLEDEAFDLDDEPVPVWIHKDIFKLINFGPGSRVIVVGQPIAMPAFDIKTRTVNPEKQRIAVNAWGIYADPSLLVPPLEEELLVEQ